MDPSVRARMDAVRERLAREDPDVLAAVAEVDRALLQWSAGQSHRQRLVACTNAISGLARIRRASSTRS